MIEQNNTESLTPISDFNEKIFTVEYYQRGYKWQKQQVEDLLNDLKEFAPDAKNEGSKYCLQPIVVINKENKEIELVDGQQRLTTIFIILSYIDKCNFSILYNTRKGSKLFLEKIIAQNDLRLIDYDPEEDKDQRWKNFINKCPILLDENGKEVKTDNVDNYHFFQAYNYIHDWFQDVENKKFKNALFFLNRLTVICYAPEINEGLSPEKIFRNINSNKIELTNAELIKGTLIIKGTNETDDTHKLYKQLEIAKDWEYIENSLHNDQLWYFLKPDKTYRNRIEFLFELYESIYVKEQTLDKKDKYFLFHALNNKDLNQVWTETVQIFNIITEWFDDTNLEMYHFVGYCISADIFTKKELIERWNNKPKDLFLIGLKTVILASIGEDSRISSASFNKSKQEVTKILLLHNVLSLRLRDDKNANSFIWASRFRFDLYIYEQWSLEHIHAQNEAPRDSFENIKPWITSTVRSLKWAGKWTEEIKNDFTNLEMISECKTIEDWKPKSNLPPKLGLLIEQIALFQEKIAKDEEDKDKIENLALLSQSINSSIGNGYFNEKREAVIACDKKGKYLLPTTKNVFLKFYEMDNTHFDNKEATNLYEWGTNDKKAYLDDIIQKINILRKEMN
jgi:uncharacterized protein with ParB-like and HNH nuclease domain